MPHRPTVAIVGAGFSGLLTALHLVADPSGPRVRLIERSRTFGRGTAYATANSDHLLNVRVANMSAFPDQPDHFTKWLAGRSGWSAHGGFVTRGVYGDYLQDLLRQALEATPPNRLLLEQDEAVDLQPLGAAGWRVKLGLGRELTADAVVLASGVLRPAAPACADPDLLASPRYIADPWSAGASLDGEGDVLLIGAGLTMVDVAIGLVGPGRRVWAISRRGLLPRTHAPVATRPPIARPQGSPLAVLRQVRAAAGAENWREAIDDLRPHVPALWGGWSEPQRAAFLRHLRPWWDISRHRLAPSVARQIGEAMRARELTLRAGEIQGLAPMRDNVEVTWRPRGGQSLRRLSVAAVINCTGFAGDLAQADDPLLANLAARGLIRPDAHRLGLEIDDRAQPLSWEGGPTPGLYAVGPLTRGAVWEMTSVPDIRHQAADTARAILAGLPKASASAA